MSRKNRRQQQQKQAPKPAAAPTEPKVRVNAMTVFRAEDAAMKESVRHAMAADGFENFATRVGTHADNAFSQGTYDFDLITRNRVKLEAAYRGSWVAGVGIDAFAEDMTREGIKVETNKGEENIKQLMSSMTRLQINQSMGNNIRWGRLYGGSIAVIQIKGQKLDTPLDLETVGKGQFQGLAVFDRWQLNPILQDTIESGPDMGLPRWYEIVNNPIGGYGQGDNYAGQVSTQTTPGGTGGGMRVHHTRCIRYIGIELPYFQATTEMMWGESVLERLWDRLIAFDNATMSSAQLIDRANLRTIGVEGLRQILGQGGEAQNGLYAMFDMMRLLQTNEGLTLIDKEDTFQSTAYSFAGLSDMMLQFGQQLAGAWGIPLVRFFGQSPAGLSATGESDLRMYYDNIKAVQEAKLRNGWDDIIKVMWRSEFGKEAPDDLEFSFVPLWQESSTDKASNAKTKTETVIGAYEAQLTSKASALKDLRDMSKETGLFSNITEDEIKESEDASELDPPPGEPGAAGEEKPSGPPIPTLSLAPKASTGDVANPRGVIARWLSKLGR